MSLHIEVGGQGDPLVMLHGWGMHGGIWGDTVAQLAQDFAVHSVDLPGHGASGMPGAFTLDGVVEQLAAEFEQPVALMGWSLGGIIAQRWAVREPHKVKRLVLVASTPCFAAREGWQWGMPLGMLEQFAADLEKDHAATLRRFLGLQVRSSEGERELLVALRGQLFCRGEPDLRALRGGLDILRAIDLRRDLSRIAQPTLVVAGRRDRLTPPQASHYLGMALPNARVVEIEGAAHAPFLSHPRPFIGHLKRFLHE